MAVSFAYEDDDKPKNRFLKKALSDNYPGVNRGLIKKSPAFPRGFLFHFAKEINSLSLGSFDIHGVESFLTFDEVESDYIVFFDFISQTTGVYEVLFSSALVFNESESFGLIIEFDNTFVHCVKLFY
jgi:hypothetical protein